MPRTYHRDPKGRFCRKPAPTLIDPVVLKTLGQGRRAVEMTADQEWEIVILERKRYTVLESVEEEKTCT
jgi:hypothetical protein